MQPPVFDIDREAFWADPYPAYREMRERAPICYVPQCDAVLLTKRDDVYACEKNIEVFSSEQPGGLMTVLMGEKMLRKSGEAHQAVVVERVMVWKFSLRCESHDFPISPGPAALRRAARLPD